MSSAFLITFPFSSLRVILGFKSVLLDWALQSITDLEDIPVASSVVSWIETPSIKSTKLAVPLFSAITGVVYGSHSQIFVLALTLSPLLKNNFDP